MTETEAIEKLKNIARDFEEEHLDTCGVPYEYDPEEASESVKMGMKALEKQRWILPSERLPEVKSESEWLEVIATLTDGSVLSLNISVNQVGERVWWEGNPGYGWRWKDSDIAAWKPLPEAYEEKENAKEEI